jgi:hypothetical protein
VKRRTGLLFSSAVVLGLVGGTAAGFLIQRARSETPLPPLQQTLTAAAVPGPADPHDAKTDDGAKLDGDLRALLVPKPAGAKDPLDITPRDWITKADLAEYYKTPNTEFERLGWDTFRRAARTGWTNPDGTEVEIDLIQFRSTDGASSYFTSTGFPRDPLAPTLKNTATGYVGVDYEKDSDGVYSAYGVVRHGTVVAQVFVTSTKQAPSDDAVAKVMQDQADLL